MAFKVLAAVLAICVAQSAVSAGPLSVYETSQDVNKNDMVQQYGLGWLGCLPYIPDVFKVAQEIQGLIEDSIKLNIHYVTLVRNCRKSSDRALCLKNAYDTVNEERSALFNKLLAILPDIWDVGLRLAGCMLG